MRKSRLQLAQSGGDVSEICRKLGVTRTGGDRANRRGRITASRQRDCLSTPKRNVQSASSLPDPTDVRGEILRCDPDRLAYPTKRQLSVFAEPVDDRRAHTTSFRDQPHRKQLPVRTPGGKLL